MMEMESSGRASLLVSGEIRISHDCNTSGSMNPVLRRGSAVGNASAIAEPCCRVGELMVGIPTLSLVKLFWKLKTLDGRNSERGAWYHHEDA
jgi:hypothetical protein